jgi:ribosomal protein L13
MNTQRETIVIDATDKAVGRIATEVAMALRGKNKPTFTPHIDAGAFVTVNNASKIKFTGRKFVQCCQHLVQAKQHRISGQLSHGTILSGCEILWIQ